MLQKQAAAAAACPVLLVPLLHLHAGSTRGWYTAFTCRQAAAAAHNVRGAGSPRQCSSPGQLTSRALKHFGLCTCPSFLYRAVICSCLPCHCTCITVCLIGACTGLCHGDEGLAGATQQAEPAAASTSARDAPPALRSPNATHRFVGSRSFDHMLFSKFQ